MNRLLVNENFGNEYKMGRITTYLMDGFDEVITERRWKDKKWMGVLPIRKDSKEAAWEIMYSSQPRVEELTDMLGRVDFIYQGEYRRYAWAVEYAGCEAIIFSGRGKGTSVEIILRDGEPTGSVLEFFKYFKKMMREFAQK